MQILQIIRIQPGKDVQITQLPLKYTRVKYPPQGVSYPPPTEHWNEPNGILSPACIGVDWLWETNRFSAARGKQYI